MEATNPVPDPSILDAELPVTLERDPTSVPFFDGAHRGEFMLRRCSSCDTWCPPEALACAVCGHGDLAWMPSGGAGTLFSWTTIWRAPEPYSSEVPFVLAEVELDEGPHFLSRLTGDTSDLRVGRRVVARFVRPATGEPFPIFAIESGAE